MAHENTVASLAFYYREPLTLDHGDRKIPNPRITEAIRWFEDSFVTPKAAADFSEKVKRRFKPTSTVPFPTLADLEEIDRSDLGMPEIKRYEGFSIPEALENYASESDGVSFDGPTDDRSDLREIYDKAERNFNQALRDHGVNRVYQAYREYTPAP